MDIVSWLQSTASRQSCGKQEEQALSGSSTPSKIRSDKILRKDLNRSVASSGSPGRAELNCPSRRGCYKIGTEQIPVERVAPASRGDDGGSTTEQCDLPFRKRKRHKPHSKPYQPGRGNYPIILSKEEKEEEEEKREIQDQDRWQQFRRLGRKRKRSTRDPKLVDASLQGFQPKNVRDKRLTLQPHGNVGLFNRIRVSSERKINRGLPDLVFPKMRFLSKECRSRKPEPRDSESVETQYQEAQLDLSHVDAIPLDLKRTSSQSNTNPTPAHEVDQTSLSDSRHSRWLQGMDLTQANSERCEREKATSAEGPTPARPQSLPQRAPTASTLSSFGRKVCQQTSHEAMDYSNPHSPGTRKRKCLRIEGTYSSSREMTRQHCERLHLGGLEARQDEMEPCERNDTFLPERRQRENLPLRRSVPAFGRISFPQYESCDITNMLLLCNDTMNSHLRKVEETRLSGISANKSFISKASISKEGRECVEKKDAAGIVPGIWLEQDEAREQVYLPRDEELELEYSDSLNSESEETTNWQDYDEAASTELHHSSMKLTQPGNAVDGVLSSRASRFAIQSSRSAPKVYTIDPNSSIRGQDSRFCTAEQLNNGMQINAPPNFWRPNRLY